MSDHIKRSLQAFIADKARLPSAESVPPSADLVAMGILNSMLLVSIFLFLEEEFGADPALGIEDFSDLTSVDRLYLRFFGPTGSASP